jgi:hypothetical protein
MIADDKNNVALRAVSLRSQLSDIHSANPIRWNVDFGAGIPIASTNAFLADWRIGLGLTFERPETLDETPTRSAIIPKAIEIDRKRR